MDKLQELKNKINEITEKVPKKYVRGNIAYALLEYNGEEKEIITSSKVHQQKDIKGFTFSSSKNSNDYRYLNVNNKGVVDGEGGYFRYNDTEAKIFVLITEFLIQNKIKEPFMIFLYTTNIPCISCYYLFDQFRRQFPFIEMNIYSHSDFYIHIGRSD